MLAADRRANLLGALDDASAHAPAQAMCFEPVPCPTLQLLARRLGLRERQDEERTPVMARQDSFGYHLSSFLGRHKLAVGVAGAIMALVVAFAVAMTLQAAQIARQRDRAEQERVRAELEKGRAEQVSSFLADLFKEADPWRKGAETITERELLDRGAEKIER